MRVFCLCLSMLFLGCSGNGSNHTNKMGDTDDTDTDGGVVNTPLSKCIPESELLELAERIRSVLPKSRVKFSAELTLCECPVPEVPDTTVPEVPDTTVPEVPDTTVPEVPDTTVPDTTVPEVPDTTVPEVPGTIVPDTTVPDTTVPDTTVPDEENGCPPGFIPRPYWYIGNP